jgi:uncharacterized protein YndB with AHSA1/START domain
MKDDATVREVTITHVFEAPRDLVWRAWTEADQLARWFMPHGFTIPVCEVDLREGGAFHMTVRGPDGSEHASGGVFKEIVPPERLVFTQQAFEGPDGAPLLEVLQTATFADRGDTTELTLRAVVLTTAPETAGALAGMEEGWLQSLEKLDAILTGRDVDTSSREIVATHLLDAPLETVWRAWTDPEHVARWWARDGFTMTTEEMDVRAGGRWRLTLHGPDGADIPATATYLAVQEPAVLAYLSGDPSEPGHAFTTVEFSDDDHKTGVTVRLHFASAEERTRMVEENGAQRELEASLDRLATAVREAS